jgi:hypothetical protein
MAIPKFTEAKTTQVVDNSKPSYRDYMSMVINRVMDYVM